MKHQYFGDINDYRKYGLLRALGRASGLSIGVVWLLTRNDDGGDGELRNYLTKPSRWRHYDPELYDQLQRLLQPEVRRTVQHARDWDLISGAAYFEALVTDNRAERQSYFSAAFAALRGYDLIFLDPDIGIEVQSTKFGTRGSSGYVYWSELQEAYGHGHSLLIYQHFPRVVRERFVPFLAGCLAERLGAPQVKGFATRHVAFFLVPQTAHLGSLNSAAADVRSRWRGEIDVWSSGKNEAADHGQTQAGLPEHA